MIFQKFGYNFKIAFEAIIQNKLRSILTSLGIIFGVASVIAMLAIGRGAEEQILNKMEILGSKNLIINTIVKKKKDAKTEDNENENIENNKYTPGLTLKDAQSIINNIPGIKYISPEVITEEIALYNGSKSNVKLVGINDFYFTVNNLALSDGNIFNKKNHDLSEQVCIIGYGLISKLFPLTNPIGQHLKCGDLWYKVTGVVKEKYLSEENIDNLGIRDYNNDVYIPINTMVLRHRNRSLVTEEDIKVRDKDDEYSEELYNHHQLNRLVVSIENTDLLNVTTEIIGRLLLRRHNGVKDFEIVVPKDLLEQEQSTKRMFNIVLGVIASISLLVGGIGIMNIMLASVLERTKEIGIRRAIGAKENDILFQFLIEAVTISLTGGIIGVFVGVSFSYIIELTTEIKTIVSPFSVFLSFFVSISIGLIFGIMPAKKAAKQNTIDLLRYE